MQLTNPKISVLVGGAALAVAALALLRRRKTAAARGVLHASPVSTCSRRALAALEEAGCTYCLQPVALHKGEQPPLKLQPYGKVPAWQGIDGLALFESRAIMRYAAEGTALVPAEVMARAVMEQWISVEYSYFSPAFLPIYLMRVVKKLPLDEAAVGAHRAALEPTLDLMEARLAKAEHLAGAAYSLADLTFACYFEVFEAAGLRDLLDVRPALAAWWARCAARPAWRRVVEGRVPTAVEESDPSTGMLGF